MYYMYVYTYTHTHTHIFRGLLLSFRAASPGFSLTSGLCPAFSPASASGLWLDAADEAQPIC